MSHRPRKRFGQNFLHDQSVIERILSYVDPRPGQKLVEIGPGQGALTRGLLQRSGELDAIELDRDLLQPLQNSCGRLGELRIHNTDALKFDFRQLRNDQRQLRLVGNLPYNISTPLLFHLLKFRDRILDMHFMLQKEVVERLAATPGSKAYGRLGIMLGCHLSVESLFDVDRLAFDPPPAVMSAVVRLDPLPPGTYTIDDEAGLSTLVATAFMKRRKTLRNSLKTIAEPEDFEAVGIDSGLRPEQLEIAEYISLGNHLHRKSTRQQ